MDYYGLLFLYYLKGLSGKSILRLFFNIEVGGTEQLLPENTSTPTTTPILADIQYPDGLRTDQYFTYRETPTTISNKARIKTIKGNTLNWNQLVQNGNFADTSLWGTYSSTGFSVSNNVGSFTVTGSTGAIYQTNTPTYVSGHKYLVIADFYVSQQANISVEVSGTRGKTETVNANTWYRYSDIVAPSAQGNLSLTCGQTSVQVKNVMCFDLAQMGLDITDPSEFVSIFSLPYYAYNQGTLLSFMGNGIKTVGKNLFDGIVKYANSNISDSGVISGGQANYDLYAFKLFSGSYTLTYTETYTSVSTTSRVVGFADSNYSNGTLLGKSDGTASSRSISFTITDKPYVLVQLRKTATNIQLEKGSATSYEPYTESVLSLPISTYFTNGMKSAGSVYDELTESKAITRIGSVDLGSLAWSYASSVPRFFSYGIENVAKPSTSNTTVANILCSKFTSTSLVGNNPSGTIFDGNGDKLIAISDGGVISVRDTSYTDATAFKTAMSGVYLYYELAEYQETAITTEDANEALSLLMGKSVSSDNANQLINIITKGE